MHGSIDSAPSGTSQPTRSERRLVRTLALAILLALPVELVVQNKYGEPYPALTQPSFASVPAAPGITRSSSPKVLVTFRDGSKKIVKVARFFGSKSIASSLASYAFKHQSARTRNLEVRKWMYQRAVAATRRDDVEAVKIVWVYREFDSHSGEVLRKKVLRTVSVEPPT